MQPHNEQGTAIRAARIAKRMTQAHLAAAAGVSEKTVRRAESGDRLQVENLRALCATLDLDAQNLRTEGEMVPGIVEEMRERMLEQRVAAIGIVSLLLVSICVTFAEVVFGPWHAPAWAWQALRTVAWSALGLTAVALAMFAFPATRGRLLRSLPFRLVTSPVLMGAGLMVATVLIIMNVPPMLGLLVVEVKGFVDAPSLHGAAGCALGLYGAYLLCSILYRALSADDGRPGEDARTGKPAA